MRTCTDNPNRLLVFPASAQLLIEHLLQVRRPIKLLDSTIRRSIPNESCT